jgi:siderophore-iron reductase FhuF
MEKGDVFSIRRQLSMAKQLTEKEMLLLQKYRFNPQLEQSYAITNLLDEVLLKKFMGNLAKVIGAPSDKVAASIFVKRYAFVAVMALYAMSVWNKKLNVSLDTLWMETTKQGNNWQPSIRLKDLTVEEWEATALSRADWRKKVLKDLFAKNIDPILSMLEKTFRISKLILWENISVYLFWLYEKELKDSRNEQVLDDFQYLIFEAEGALFGDCHENPLQKYYTEKVYMANGEKVRLRKTCCFTYQLSGSTKRCKTCPCTYLGKDGRCINGKENICGAVRGLT